jgi:hypothetical protein
VKTHRFHDVAPRMTIRMSARLRLRGKAVGRPARSASARSRTGWWERAPSSILPPSTVRRPPKPPPAPRIPADVETRAAMSLRSFDSLEACRLEGCDLSKQVADRVAFEGVRVEGGTMAESRLPRLRWSDVACIRTDLSTVV